MDNSTLIKDYSTSLTKAFYEKVLSLKRLRHKLSKGELRELFLNDLLTNFITEQFGIGTGVIVDSYGNESNQVDIIIYDNRILPPIIKNSHLGVYPLEAVLAIIEVKSTISRAVLLEIEEKFKIIDNKLLKHKKIKEDIKVLKGVIGFNRNPINEIKDAKTDWLVKNIQHIDTICHVQKYSWIRWLSKNRPWKYCNKNEKTFEETKRFIAWILDIARSKSNRRQQYFSQEYIPWLSSYIRNGQEII